MQSARSRGLVLVLVLIAVLCPVRKGNAQAALLMEEPYGFFGALNPTGHTALYFARICAETPVRLRRCEPGEQGSVIARYQGIAGYDWVAMPLVPYLYSVENVSQVPDHVDKESVQRMRQRYHEQHLGALGSEVFEGNLVHGGWNQLVGVAYERRIFAFRFATTEEQDDALIEFMNSRKNDTEFDLIYNNCADFARNILNRYYPKTFRRTFFPDAGMTTPRQITYKLVRYAKKHPDTQLTIFEIPQIPGYRHMSHSNKSVSASLMTTAYAVPLTLLNPYLAGAIFVDYLVRGRYPLMPKHPLEIGPYDLGALTGANPIPDNPAESDVRVSSGKSTSDPSATQPQVNASTVNAPSVGYKEVLAEDD